MTTADVALLTEADIAHFKRCALTRSACQRRTPLPFPLSLSWTPRRRCCDSREGYVIKYGLLDPELMAQCRHRLFAGAPPSITSDDPSSWIGPINFSEELGSGMHGIAMNSRAGHTWKERVAGGEQLMLDLLPNRLLPIAEQLLGKGQVYPATGEDVSFRLELCDLPLFA
jgi:hypothetical protein